MDDNKEERINAIKERYVVSRASLVTQLFVTLATAHGVGMTSVISLIGRDSNSGALTPYLVAIVFVLGFGLLFIVASAFVRFRYSKYAEELELKRLGEDYDKEDNRSTPFYKWLMYSSALCLVAAIFIGIAGTFVYWLN